MNVCSSGLNVARRNVTRIRRLTSTRSLEFADEEASYRIRHWCRCADRWFRGLRRRQCGEAESPDRCRAIVVARFQLAAPALAPWVPWPSALELSSLPAVPSELRLL